MKKIFFGLVALLSLGLVLATTGCEMTYGENEYPALVQWYAGYTGSSGDWVKPGDEDTELSYNADNGKYEMTLETTIKNVELTLCTAAGESYPNQRFWDDADADTQANFTWTDSYGHKQLVISKPGEYLIAVDPATKIWSVTAQ